MTEAEEDNEFAVEYRNARGELDYEWMARVLSGRLRQMDKRAAKANKRADELERAFKNNNLVLMPREPTEAMLKAAAKALSPAKRPTQEWMSVKEKHRYRYRMMVKAYEGGEE